jgi:GNAT superfamily N-acetyltransferase
MKLLSRSYQSKDDLYAIGALIRNVWARAPYYNAWTFCRFDIWAQRRIVDSEVFGDYGWQQHFQIWEDENKKIVGAAFAFDNHHWRKNPDPLAIILDPDYPELAIYMLDWAEENSNPDVEVTESNIYLRNLVQSRRYLQSNDFMVFREKSLSPTDTEPVILPPGYNIEILKHSSWIPYFIAVNAVFNMMDNVDSFRSIQQGPSNVPELHLNVVTENKEIAAFCSVWLDRDNNLASFEPVGTVPQFQKKGLGVALLAHASNKLREMGCPLVTVESWSESVGANKLYSAAGLVEKGRMYSWKK